MSSTLLPGHQPNCPRPRRAPSDRPVLGGRGQRELSRLLTSPHSRLQRVPRTGFIGMRGTLRWRRNRGSLLCRGNAPEPHPVHDRDDDPRLVRIRSRQSNTPIAGVPEADEGVVDHVHRPPSWPAMVRLSRNPSRICRATACSTRTKLSSAKRCRSLCRLACYGVGVPEISGRTAGAAIVISPAIISPVKVGFGPKMPWLSGACFGSKKTVKTKVSRAAPPP